MSNFIMSNQLFEMENKIVSEKRKLKSEKVTKGDKVYQEVQRQVQAKEQDRKKNKEKGACSAKNLSTDLKAKVVREKSVH